MIKQRQSGRFPLVSDARVQIDEFFDQLIVPQRPAPVFFGGGDAPRLEISRFALLPRWSKEPRVKFATHNARLETIDEKPTWKQVFVERHCLVPLTEFIEPIYTGEHAGNMVAFGQEGGALLLAAGVWDEWVNRATGEVVRSFAIITSDPLPFIAEVGHDRCPVFLKEEAGLEWLANEKKSPALLKEFLKAEQCKPDFTVARHRAMRPGWEKRK